MLPTTTKDHARRDSRVTAFAKYVRRRRTPILVISAFAIFFLIYITFIKSPPAQVITTSVVHSAELDANGKAVAFDPLKNMKILSWKPRIFTFENFLTSEECDFLINLGRDKLERSRVVGAEKEEVIADRSSSGFWIPYEQSSFVDKRIAAVTHMHPSHGEQLHLLHYEKTQQYKPHFDWFPRQLSDAQEQQIKDYGQRIATMIIFLANVEEGGETWFPKVNIKVVPKKGDAVLFYDLTPDGKEDEEALHGGMPGT
jgi:prolyl 4-hydroxylase